MVNFFSPNIWQMITFLNLLDALWVTSEARGSVSVGFWGSRQLSPFFWGGSSQGGSIAPPPPQSKARLPRWVRGDRQQNMKCDMHRAAVMLHKNSIPQ